MNASLFGRNPGLDVAFLNEAYANDAETAAYVFQMYLDELPTNLDLLNESLRNSDIERFRQLIHKQKPGYSYVGLTDITAKLEELQVKCTVSDDLRAYKEEINEVLSRIHASADLIERALNHLHQIKRA